MWNDAEEEISASSVLFCPPKHFAFLDPALCVEQKGEEIVVTARAYAKGVEIEFPDSDVLLSDNYFDMDAGSKTVRIIRGVPGKITVRSMYDIR